MAFKRHHIQPDTPTNNFATWNPLDKARDNTVLSGGNLISSDSTESYACNYSNMVVPNTGLYYIEFYLKDYAASNAVGIYVGNYRNWPSYYGPKGYPCDSNTFMLMLNNGRIYCNPTEGPGTSYPNSSISTVSYHPNVEEADNIVALIIDGSSRNVWLQKNGEVIGGDNYTPGSQSGGVVGKLGHISKLPAGDMYVFTMASGRADGQNRTSTLIMNAGQDHTFLGNKSGGGNYQDANGIGSFYYPPPAGALALCTENLPVTPITAHLDEKPEDYFKAVTYTGNSETTRTINVGFPADLIWIKSRDHGNPHNLFDSVRGFGSASAGNNLQSDNYEPQNKYGTYGYISSITSTEMEVSSGNNNASYVNKDGNGMIAWCWKAGGSAGKYNVNGKAYSSATEAGLNAGTVIPTGASVNTKSGFSIIRMTTVDVTSGTAPNALSESFSHGLPGAPDVVIGKGISDSSNQWHVYHKNMNDGNKPTDLHGIRLNQAEECWKNSSHKTYEIESSVVKIGRQVCDGNGKDMIFYCWKEVPGYSAFGSYTGNGSTDGPFVYTGFKPAFVMIKNTNTDNTSWIIHDSARDPYNEVENIIQPNDPAIEASYSTTGMDFLSNGFKLRGNSSWYGNNSSSQNAIYMAFAEKPETPASRVTITKPDLKVNDMRSMYFDGSSNYLSRTFSNTSTSRRQQTVSFWVKPSSISGSPRILFIRNSNGQTQGGCYISNDKFKYFSRVDSSGVGDVNTNTTISDFSAWHHVVFKIDHINTSTEIYVNGVSQSLTTNAAISNSDNCFFINAEVNIGREPVAGGSMFNGYLANIHFIDGQALESSAFAESANGVWIPKQYEGEYGTNGFHLDFAPENMEYSGDTITRVLDESPNSNHWTAH